MLAYSFIFVWGTGDHELRSCSVSPLEPFLEMFEHMKNYEKLLEKISGWMKPTGKLFIHIFTHKWKSYHFDKGIYEQAARQSMPTVQL